MSPLVIGILGLAGFLLLMFFGVPIPFAMLFSGAVGIAVIKGGTTASQLITADLMNYFSSYTLTVGPLFGLMGFLALYSGVGEQLYSTVNAFLCHRRGGLASATQVACAAFGAISGSVPACITTMCSIAYPEMRKRGYSPGLAGPSICAGACLSVLIPPSSSFIIYGIATETSIGALFIAGIIPGLLLMCCNILAIWIVAKRHPEQAPTTPRKTRQERWEIVKRGGIIEVAVVFIISMGGMIYGFFTATEAGAVGTFGMLVVTLVTRKIDLKRYVLSILASARLAAMVFLLLACATIFGRLFTVAGIPAALGSFVRSLDVPGWVILAVIMIIYFILGMVTDLLSMTLITMPVFFPIVTEYLGYSPIWFGVILTIMWAVGGTTPPVGSGIFMVKACTNDDPESSLALLFKGGWPFVIAAVGSMIILIIFPQLATWLPSLTYTF